jgi:hypothetical protein
MGKCSKCKKQASPRYKYCGMVLCKSCLDIVTHPEKNRIPPTPIPAVLASVLNGLARRHTQSEPELVTDGEKQG